MDVSYVGSRTHEARPTNAFNALSAPNLALGDVTAGRQSEHLNAAGAESVPGLLPGTSLNGATVTRQQSLLPFPQFTAFNHAEHSTLEKSGTTRCR